MTITHRNWVGTDVYGDDQTLQEYRRRIIPENEREKERKRAENETYRDPNTVNVSMILLKKRSMKRCVCRMAGKREMSVHTCNICLTSILLNGDSSAECNGWVSPVWYHDHRVYRRTNVFIRHLPHSYKKSGNNIYWWTYFFGNFFPKSRTG